MPVATCGSRLVISQSAAFDVLFAENGHIEKENVLAITLGGLSAIRCSMQRRIGQYPVYGSTILPELAGSRFEVFWIRFKPIHVWTGGKDDSNQESWNCATGVGSRFDFGVRTALEQRSVLHGYHQH